MSMFVYVGSEVKGNQKTRSIHRDICFLRNQNLFEIRRDVRDEVLPTSDEWSSRQNS
jgi:hypothetical protein